MSKKVKNYGVYVEKPNVQGNMQIAGRDIINTQKDITKDEFKRLLREVQQRISQSSIETSDKRGASANMEIAIEQTNKKKPNKQVIVNSLTTAFSIISQVGGAAKAIAEIGDLLRKAIDYAQHLF